MKALMIISTLTIGGLVIIGSVQNMHKSRSQSAAWFQEVMEAREQDPAPPPDPDNPFAMKEDDEWYNVSGWLPNPGRNGDTNMVRFYNPETGAYLDKHGNDITLDD